jgi:thymidylate synthase ThyX
MISAKIICDSINSYTDTRITTFELEYPRFIHAELMTHRVFSRNSASSRAIPVSKVIEQIYENPATPIHWGRNQSGMQAKEELSGVTKELAEHIWSKAARKAADFAFDMTKCELHKQVVNRITEPFQHMKVVLTSTEFANWFWLRDHADAQPEIKDLASKMQDAMNKSNPFLLSNRQWHIPYVTRSYIDDELVYYDCDGNRLSLNDALILSASCCAQVSYRKSDTSMEKARMIYSKLIESEPCHASPIEHQAMAFRPWPKAMQFDPQAWENGVTHVDKQGNWYSGNFKNFVQYRQLIPNNAKHG